MKKIFIITLFFLVFTQTAAAQSRPDEKPSFLIARTVKIGRNGIISTGVRSVPAVSPPGTTAKPAVCDPSCSLCSPSGQCTRCPPGRYISTGACRTCPANFYCDGETATPNCSGVSCLSGYFPSPNATGCCCS